jgi:OOP family OmpA-OmpF porin
MNKLKVGSNSQKFKSLKWGGKTMKTKSVAGMTVLGMVLIAFLATNASAFELITKKETVMVANEQVELVRVADNFIVLFDASKSMHKLYKDTNKKRIDVAREFLKDRNEMLPDLGWQAGLYKFSGLYLSWEGYTYYDMQPYNKAKYAEAIDQLPKKAEGQTVLQHALHELDGILAKLSGRTVVFLFTDGTWSPRDPRKPLDMAKKLAQKYDVCFDIISTADDKRNQEMLKNVASINACSRVVPFDELVSKPGYLSGALFVMDEKVVMTPEIREKLVGVKSRNILFDFNRSNVKSEFDERPLGLTAAFLKENPQAYVILAGFTDSIGSQEYNMKLSRRRAEAVGKHLEDLGVDAEQIVLNWYGEAAPVASNSTAEGRSQNRRVALIVGGLE